MNFQFSFHFHNLITKNKRGRGGGQRAWYFQVFWYEMYKKYVAS